jgi:maleate cis-trans isomerase
VVVEEWYRKVVPSGVSVHFVRMLIADGSSPDTITSTQAVLWHLLRLAGVNTPIHGFGRLLREF